MLQQLKERYTRYEETVKKVRENAPAAAGLFGLGDDPRKHPCHGEFYEDVGRWTADFLATGPDAQMAHQAVSWIIRAAAEHRDQEVYWFMYAAHGHCRDLIPLLSRTDCAELVRFYDDHYPRRDRMPVQKEIYKLLKKRSVNK